MTHRARRVGYGLSLLVAAGVVALAGCGGDGRLATYPVAGTITLDGQPLGRAEVWLLPKDPAAQAAQPPVRPQGVSAADGTFRLSTYLNEDGAPAGEYEVLVLGGRGGAGPDDEGDPDAPAPKGGRRPPFPAKYRNAKTSGLSATVSAGPTPVELQLKSR